MIALETVTITPLHKRKTAATGDPYPYYVVHFPPDFDTRKLSKVKTVMDFRIRWEKLSTTTRGTQCHRCQQFGHGSAYCTSTPKCVKCIGNHLTKECPHNDEETTAAKCVNCNGDHPASYRNCPAYKNYKEKVSKSKQSRPSYDTNNRNTRKANEPRTIARPAARATGRSYAEATANPEPGSSNPRREPSQPANSSSAGHTSASDFQTLSLELKKLNKLCDIKQMIAMLRELNRRLSPGMDNLSKLQVMLDVTHMDCYVK